MLHCASNQFTVNHDKIDNQPPGPWLVTLRERLRSGAVIIDRDGWRAYLLRPARCFV
ncbi:MAG: hypothetical protein SOU02_07645 [Caecibacter massiliensis]|nr:hypothetical protein [Caecibacter massiliensis]